jgi:hypothetical protein
MLAAHRGHRIQATTPCDTYSLRGTFSTGEGSGGALYGGDRLLAVSDERWYCALVVLRSIRRIFDEEKLLHRFVLLISCLVGVDGDDATLVSSSEEVVGLDPRPASEGRSHEQCPWLRPV